ncbi:PREDICTED: uncharacterized protein LOC105450290 [Wasmannia auropunctata]|uniref:uncharacterized protein LOC105450290 n=1 Tax=Wasmannia auropunctata TaxID=64793 RepID=UPI0005F08F40|nr:PREDICTED: uncharacterized protein LOC105450290 [Wasmannia auropunctata]
MEVKFKVNNKLITLELQANNDIYSKQYIELLVKNGLLKFDKENQEIVEIFRIIENKENLIFHTNFVNLDHNDRGQLLTVHNEENEGTHSKFESEEYVTKIDRSCDFWSDSATSFMLDKLELYLANIGPMKKFKTKNKSGYKYQKIWQKC